MVNVLFNPVRNLRGVRVFRKEEEEEEESVLARPREETDREGEGVGNDKSNGDE